MLKMKLHSVSCDMPKKRIFANLMKNETCRLNIIKLDNKKID